MSDIKKELDDFYVSVDSLLSLLAHRHGKYLDKIGEKDEVIRLYLMARNYSEEKKVL